MTRLRRSLLLTFAVMVVLVVGVATWTYRALQHVPDFYARALSTPATNQREASHEMNRQTAALVGQAKKQGDWQATFTIEQINGWLSVDLVEQFPNLLPAEASEPRAALGEHTISLGCHYVRAGVASVIWLEVEPRLVKKNVLSLRIRRARAGNVPLPLGEAIAVASKAAREAGLMIEASEVDGDPLLLVTVLPDGKLQRVSVELLEIRGDAIVIGGHTAAR